MEGFSSNFNYEHHFTVSLHSTAPHSNYNYMCYNYCNYYNYYNNCSYTTLHYATLHHHRHHNNNSNNNSATLQLQLRYTTPHPAVAGEVADHCHHWNRSIKHNSNHLSVHQWIRSAMIHNNQPLL